MLLVQHGHDTKAARSGAQQVLKPSERNCSACPFPARHVQTCKWPGFDIKQFDSLNQAGQGRLRDVFSFYVQTPTPTLYWV